ncbi:hypothetical protein BDN72DRAFT_915436, partial [Pluteus cervinus]
FFDQNQDVIKATATGLASLTAEGRSIESTVSSFSETAKVIIKGLDALAQVHPAIGVAVIAFKLVVTFDMTRRENNKKVLALKIEMQDMMTALFELRHIRDPMEAGPDGTLLGVRIQTLMDKIAKDIKDAGSACDAYMKKSFVARTLKSKIYENRLAEYGATFETNKTELQRALSMHTVRGVDTANEKLDSMEIKVDLILQMFRKLDSPREKDVQKFLEENGGPRTCLESSELLTRLISKSGETLSEASGSMEKVEDVVSARKALLKEWQEDVEEMFRKNMVVFERKLSMQLVQLQDTIWTSSEYIIMSLRSGSDEKILDHDLKTIWKEMGWKGSVKARHLVLALYDYFSDMTRSGQTSSNRLDFKESDGTSSTPVIDDQWALAYVNVTYVQPIMEAIDDNGTGFVSIKELNNFATSAPLSWTLLQRLAYWAAGWHISVSSYKTKIYRVVQKMLRLKDRMVTPNRRLVDDYLTSYPLHCIEHLLRSTKSVETTRRHPDLGELVDRFEKEEEERLTRNLTSLAFEVDSLETVGLITGPGRIERYLFPLIYVLLKHDLRIMMIACKCTISKDELLGLRSILLVFDAVDERIEKVTGIYKQLHADVDTRLGVFAFGMIFYDREWLQFNRTESSYVTWSDDTSSTEADEEENLQDEIELIPTTELKFGPLDFSQLEELNPLRPYTAHLGDDLTPLGRWSGHLWILGPDESAISFLGLTELQIDTLSDGKLDGIGVAADGSLTVTGTLEENNDIKIFLTSDHGTLVCQGKFDPNRQRIEGSWRKDFEEARDSTSTLFSRTPSHLNQFRYDPIDFQTNPARARWAFACEAILHEVRRKSFSWTFLKSRISEIKRLVIISILRSAESNNAAPYIELSQAERYEMAELWAKLDIWVCVMCTALGEFHVNRLMVHYAGIYCNSCQRTIYGTRNLCLVCIEKDFTDHIDLCRGCLTLSPSHDRFDHNPSHSMLKFEEVAYGYNKDILAARTIAIRVKLALKTSGENDRDAPGQINSILCITCSKPVTVPCWVCRVCAPDTFICLDCEERRVVPPEGHTHELRHLLIRIGTTDPDPRSAADQLSLEEMVSALERKVEEGVAQLDVKSQERANQLEARVQQQLIQLERKMDEKLSVLETLLRQLVAQAQTAPQVTHS